MAAHKNRIVEVMVDLETLDTGPDAHVLSIGACVMDNELQQFYSVPGIDNQGRSVNDDTIDWWLKQSKQARNESFRSTSVTLEQSLVSFANWWKSIKATRIWAHGKDFDVTILTHAYQQYELKCPWRFWLTQDTRTLIKFSEKLFDGENFEPDRTGTYHNALDDAIFQAKWMKIIEGKFHELKRKTDK